MHLACITVTKRDAWESLGRFGHFTKPRKLHLVRFYAAQGHFDSAQWAPVSRFSAHIYENKIGRVEIYVYIKEGKRELKTTVSAKSESTDPDRRLFTACAETRSTVFGPPSGIASAKLDPHDRRWTADSTDFPTAKRSTHEIAAIVELGWIGEVTIFVIKAVRHRIIAVL